MKTQHTQGRDVAFEISDSAKLPAHPVVSVLMLAYNHGRYIGDAIEGVLLQDVDFPIELVIAEDCSPDNTREIVEQYQRRHPGLVRIVTSGQNVGMLANHRRALAACRGEFVAYCEGDDYWHHPRKLELQVRAMRADSTIGLVHTDYDYRVGGRVGRSLMASDNRPAPQGNAFHSLLRGYWLGTATLMYRKDVLDSFESAGIPEGEYRFGDYSRALFTAMRWKLCFIPVSTATYRYMQGSAMNSGSVSTLRLRQSVVKCRRDFMALAGCEPDDLHQIERNEYLLLYGNAYLARDLLAFDNAAAWRRDHDPAWRMDVRHRLRRILIRIGPLHALVLFRSKIQWWLSVRRRYSPMTIEQQRKMAASAP